VTIIAITVRMIIRTISGMASVSRDAMNKAR
jgi:hypothetical protein